MTFFSLPSYTAFVSSGGQDASTGHRGVVEYEIGPIGRLQVVIALAIRLTGLLVMKG